jgi:dTDP-glucose pyrophosphorylase
MTAVILAAGSSTRMAPYSDAVIPKPLLPVALASDGRMTSVLDRILFQCYKADIERVILVANANNVTALSSYIVEARKAGVQIVLQQKPGHLSAVVAGIVNVQDDILVIDGDNYFQDHATIYDFLEDCSGKTHFCAGVFKADRFDKYAMVQVDDDVIVGIREKPDHWNHPMWAKSGLFYIPLDLICFTCSMYEEGVSSTTDLIAATEDTIAVRIEETPIDIGTWDAYVAVLKSALREPFCD